MEKQRVSKMMAYLLRHDPSGMEIDRRGFVSLGKLIEKLQNRWPELSKGNVKEIVEEDSKGRYEITEDRVRALYGHSIDVEPDLPEVEVDVLFHGTSDSTADRILDQGLKSQTRRKVHLSAREEDAIEVGRRHTPNPTVLKVNAKQAIDAGIKFQRASERIFVTDYVPPRFIARLG
ncbi:MAG: RNA 2'-phosphotransferase [Candidatus Acetothermia bacterium]